jgi:hypothetical protein
VQGLPGNFPDAALQHRLCFQPPEFCRLMPGAQETWRKDLAQEPRRKDICPSHPEKAHLRCGRLPGAISNIA